MDITTWREELAEIGVTEWIAVAPDESVLDIEFNAGYGLEEGPAVLVWTESHVCFPVCYDGAEWMDKVPRNPRPEPRLHVGGG